MSVALTTLLLGLFGLLGPPAGAGAARSPANGPVCTPEALNATALLDGAVTVSPMPGAADASARTQISFLGAPLGALSAVAVIGSLSGAHTGRLEAYSQGDGGSFVAQTPFTPGERVNVSAQLTLAGATRPLAFHFTVAHTVALNNAPEAVRPVAAGANTTLAFHSRPDLKPPRVTVHMHSASDAPGALFLAPYGVAGQAGPMILNPAGQLIWFRHLRAPLVATNLRVQQLDGSPVLTWWQGTITTHGFGLGVDVVAGRNYQTIAEVRAGNGYQADLHEFQITPAGTALLSSYNAISCDLGPLGGRRDDAVTDSLLQEIDIKTGLVMFEWTSVDHIALADSHSPVAGSSPQWPFDFFHLNSINLDPDGTLLVSSRNTWAADDIDPRSGQVLWTLGGKHSSFSEARGAATAFQHDARPIGADSYTMFDNGAAPRTHARSRGVVLNVDPHTNRVSVHSQYLYPTRPLLASSQGNMQALSNGDWFVGWGDEPELSEFSASGRLLFDASLPPGYESYRALRFRWGARPPGAPALVLNAASHSGALAFVSWNGAGGIARWALLEGSSPSRLARLKVVPRTGFETTIALVGGPGERFAQVRALNAAGVVLGSSAAVAIPAQVSPKHSG